MKRTDVSASQISTKKRKNINKLCKRENKHKNTHLK